LWLAGVLGELGRFPEEHLVLKNAMARDPLNELLVVNYAGNLSTRGDWETGRALLRDLLELRPDSTMLLRSLAKMELSNGNLVEGWKLANRSYQLAPEDPEEIATLARTWVLLGDVDQAERLLLEGLKSSDQNASLLASRWLNLMVSHRYEEAEAMVRELKMQLGDEVPEAQARVFNYQLGMIALVRGDYLQARQLLMSALSESEQAAYSGHDVTVVTLASVASKLAGEDEQARELLEEADRKIQRGRLNGVDDPGIYVNEAVLLVMRSDPARAMQKLREAYEHGFREQWVLEIDRRLDPLRDQPEFISLRERIRDDLLNARVEIQSLSLVGI
jgi:Flp pilus assembly protein TadD